jgi:hypothetical protein
MIGASIFVQTALSPNLHKNNKNEVKTFFKVQQSNMIYFTSKIAI